MMTLGIIVAIIALLLFLAYRSDKKSGRYGQSTWEMDDRWVPEHRSAMTAGGSSAPRAKLALPAPAPAVRKIRLRATHLKLVVDNGPVPENRSRATFRAYGKLRVVS